MSTQLVVAGPARQRPQAAPTFPISWTDRLSGWVTGLSGPAWIYPLTFGLALIIVLHLARWASGAAPWGALNLALVFGPMFGAYLTAMYVHLTDVADRCLTGFRPALDPGGEMYARGRFDVLYAPARAMLLANLAGVAVFSWLWTSTSVLFREVLVGKPLADIPFLLVGYGNVLVLSATLFISGRRLVIVGRLQAHAPRLNLLQPEPIYAFSELWTHTTVGGMLIVLAYVALGFTPGMQPTSFSLGMSVVNFLLALTFIVAPLMATHRRLAAEKKRLVIEAHRRLEATIHRLHADIDRGRLERMDQLHKAFASLTSEIDFLSRLPTWPWRPGTIAGVVTALLLPIGLWMIQRLLEPYVGR